jgi:glutaredoxin
MARIVLILFCAMVAMHLFGGRTEAAGDPRLKTGQSGVVLLSAEWCGYCDALRQDLDKSGVQYRELDVEDDAEGTAAWEALDGQGVPVTVVGQKVVYGYDPEGIRALIGAAGRRPTKL